mmetsp:Transcript_3518/g.5884  ORF Transcript_3518/g.5884 Transcript_3518/m.5884 type:complete len:336 (+) Transcript_3518:166-1173(+)
MSGLDTLLHRLVLHKLGQESSHKGISGTIGIHQQFLGEWCDGVFGDLTVVSDNGRFGALGKDDHALALVVLLAWHVGNLECDFLEVITQVVFLGKGFRFGFVTKQVVGIRESGSELVAEEINDKRSAQVEAECLVLGNGMFGHLHKRFDTDRQEETGDVIVFSRRNQFLGLVSLQMGWFEVIGSCQVGNERTFAILNKTGASTSWGGLILHVMNEDTIGGGTLLKGLAVIIVISDGSHESSLSLVILEHPLSNTNGILSGTSSNELWAVLFNEFRVDGLVQIFGQNGGIELDSVLVQDFLRDISGNIKEGVAHAHKNAFKLAHRNSIVLLFSLYE